MKEPCLSATTFLVGKRTVQCAIAFLSLLLRHAAIHSKAGMSLQLFRDITCNRNPGPNTEGHDGG